MTSFGDSHAATAQYPNLHLMDGTGSSQSYAVVARRGKVFLGIRFTGLSDGAQFGLPGTTYLHARLRSAHNAKLAAQLDLAKGSANIVDLFQQQLALNDAWPNLPFEKVDRERASLLVGLFIEGSLITNTAAVLARIQKGNLFRKLIDYAIGQAGPENRIVNAETVSSWLAGQAKPMLMKLAAKVAFEKTMGATLQESGMKFKQQVEVIGPHAQQFQAIYQKHAEAQTISAKEGKTPDAP